MNFQDLMSRATENSRNASTQQRKSGHLHKNSSPGVSSAAVQAYLAKKQQLEQKKQAEQEAARRARVEARLEESLQQKKGTKRISTETKATATNHQTNIEERIKPKKPIHNNEHTKKTIITKTSIKETSSRHLDEQPSQLTRPSTSPKKSKNKIKTAQPNFKELLALAERNKLGFKNKTIQETNNLPKHAREESKEKQFGSKVKHKKGEEKAIDQDRKHKNKDHKRKEINNSPKTLSSPVASSKANKHKKSVQNMTIIKQSTETKKQPTSHSNTRISSQSCSKTAASRHSTNGNPYIESRSVNKNFDKSRPMRPRMGQYESNSKKAVDNLYSTREPHHHVKSLKRQHPSYYDDDEEEDDMDGFIDDGDNGDGEDYSAHIRQIFGYDRNRFADDDFDDAAMESNYSQIEREEHRSSKIAKLEDEIAFLKEQAELKREREKLLKGKKKMKK